MKRKTLKISRLPGKGGYFIYSCSDGKMIYYGRRLVYFPLINVHDQLIAFLCSPFSTSLTSQPWKSRETTVYFRGTDVSCHGTVVFAVDRGTLKSTKLRPKLREYRFERMKHLTA